MLRRVRPSAEKANESLSLASSYLAEARQVAGVGANRMSLTGAYMAWFHAARAVLFRDGIREKSHYCIELYPEHM
ncbi:MAG: HEPN domain-containing protein [Methanomicrobiaceae archaeon]|uniref:HEPN domain-containing protein n=1 Tax=hydrocarbon metagenome TaxID=938273 RepID=A0A0W8FGL8_9ZZZZ|nr:HEPN domain-containing protein [Methanomicrobiaceae archaeon]